MEKQGHHTIIHRSVKSVHSIDTRHEVKPADPKGIMFNRLIKRNTRGRSDLRR